MSLNDPHWGRSSDEEKKNDRGDNSALTASEKTAKNKTPGRIRVRRMIGSRRIRLLTVRAAPAAMPAKTMSSAIAARKVFFRTMSLRICGRIFSRRPTRLWGARAA